jgi:hypothetical protein
MKTNWSLKLTCLLVGMVMVILSGNVSAQWTPGGGGNTFNDTIIVSNSNALITGTFTATDPSNIYYTAYYFTSLGITFPTGYAHYYQITTSASGSPLTSTISVTDNAGFWPEFALMDANLNVLIAPFFTILTNGQTGQTTGSYPLVSGSTYYLEVSSYAKGTGAFNVEILNGIAGIQQVAQGTSGVSTGLSTVKGSLSSNDAPSHARKGCFADYYKLAGKGTVSITSSGFDTYLYLYDSNFKLVSSNDDSNPPGFGGSRINGVLLNGAAAIPGSTITLPGSATITTKSATMNTGTQTTISVGDGTAVLTPGGAATIKAGIMTTVATRAAAITTGSATINIGSTTITTGTATITSGTLTTTIVPGAGAVITTGSDWGTDITGSTITTGTALITSGSGTTTITSGSGTIITYGPGKTSTSHTYYVELTSYAKNATGNYTLSLSSTSGGLVQVTNPWDPSGSGSVNGSPVPLAFTAAGTLSSASLSHARPGRYANYYQILTSATAGGATTITVSGFDSYLYVYNQKGGKIASNDDSTPPGGGGSRVSVNLAAGQAYTVEVTSYFVAASSSYTFSVSSSKSSGTVAPISNPFQ